MRKRFPPRKPVVLSESAERRLGMYAVAAGAAGVTMLALAVPAEARIVYTPTHVKLVEGTPFPIDLNKDGIVDFFLIQYFFHGDSAIGLSACQYVNSGIWGPFCYQKIGANAIRVTKPSKWATDLLSGAIIKADDRFRGGDVALGSVGWFSTTRWSGPWMNGGNGVKNRYLGLRFKVGRRFHFGWARISVKRGPPPQVFTTVLTGYAYETIPGKPIIAGATKDTDDNNVEQPDASLTSPIRDTPQLATLGALALGAPGLSIWRREESVAATPERN